MLPEKRIEMVHFQLTKRCNLHCWFCGQWGEKGFFSAESGEEMKLDDWKKAACEVAELNEKAVIVLWGGEPLCAPFFDELVLYLKNFGFTLELVTNGTLIDKHIDVLKTCFDIIHVSVDGCEELHDSIRGKGMYRRVSDNIHMLSGGRARICTMSVLTEEFYKNPEKNINALTNLMQDDIILQEMIALDQNEVQQYKDDMMRLFCIKAEEIDAYVNNNLTGRTGFDFTENNARANIDFIPHIKEGVCLSPFRHVHITWNGKVLYCTDFYDFDAGNIRNESLKNIFSNEKSELFRRYIAEGGCPTCCHCSWRGKKDYKK